MGTIMKWWNVLSLVVVVVLVVVSVMNDDVNGEVTGADIKLREIRLKCKHYGSDLSKYVTVSRTRTFIWQNVSNSQQWMMLYERSDPCHYYEAEVDVCQRGNVVKTKKALYNAKQTVSWEGFEFVCVKADPLFRRNIWVPYSYAHLLNIQDPVWFLQFDNLRYNEQENSKQEIATCDPTPIPTRAPTSAPSNAPSNAPSSTPSTSPSNAPSSTPSTSPSNAPSNEPSNAPSNAPSTSPSNAPSTSPSSAPSNAPSTHPSSAPSQTPSQAPSNAPSTHPSSAPSTSPSNAPSSAPSTHPSSAPSQTPSQAPSNAPSTHPSSAPSTSPSNAPSSAPSTHPSSAPSQTPSQAPSNAPSTHPSSAPSTSPSQAPSTSPSNAPSASPTPSPTPSPYTMVCTDIVSSVLSMSSVTSIFPQNSVIRVKENTYVTVFNFNTCIESVRNETANDFQVKSATLRLRRTNILTFNSPFTLFRLLTPCKYPGNSDMSYADVFGANEMTTCMGEIVDFQATNSGTHEHDISMIFNRWIVGEEAAGFVLAYFAGEGGVDEANFESSTGTVAERPQLTVELMGAIHSYHPFSTIYQGSDHVIDAPTASPTTGTLVISETVEVFILFKNFDKLLTYENWTTNGYELASAQLELYANSVKSGGTVVFPLLSHGITSDSDDCATSPSMCDSLHDTSHQSYQLMPIENEWTSIDVTFAVYRWLKGVSNFGFGIRSTSPANELTTFHSKENPNSVSGPRLIMNFEYGAVPMETETYIYQEGWDGYTNCEDQELSGGGGGGNSGTSNTISVGTNVGGMLLRFGSLDSRIPSYNESTTFTTTAFLHLRKTSTDAVFTNGNAKIYRFGSTTWSEGSTISCSNVHSCDENSMLSSDPPDFYNTTSAEVFAGIHYNRWVTTEVTLIFLEWYISGHQNNGFFMGYFSSTGSEVKFRSANHDKHRPILRVQRSRAAHLNEDHAETKTFTFSDESGYITSTNMNDAHSYANNGYNYNGYVYIYPNLNSMVLYRFDSIFGTQTSPYEQMNFADLKSKQYTLKSAQLNLTTYSVTHGTTPNLHLFRVGASAPAWIESAVTCTSWGTDCSKADMISKDLVDDRHVVDFSISNLLAWSAFSLDITEIFRPWYEDDYPYNGFIILKESVGVGNSYITSSEYSSTSRKPKMEVTFERLPWSPTPAPTNAPTTTPTNIPTEAPNVGP